MYIEEAYQEEIREEAIKLLKSDGVKHGLKKQDLKAEYDDDIKVYKVFQTSLGLLEKERVFISQSEHPVEVPVFVIDACHFIKQDLNIEGLFRKAGSAAKQRELKILLDCGNRLDQNDEQTIINVANTLKMFFRELPEPLIPLKFHNLFLRCLNCKGNHVQAILWACLLLPLTHLNTLAYLMQFLSEVSHHSDVNKMDEANLSIIFTPTLMPVNSRKLTSQGGAMINQRMKVIQVLLRNSSKIGVIPEIIRERLGLYVSNSFSSADDLDSSVTRRKRRKKRSSSLNRVISGIKKMITKPSPETIETNFSASHIPHTPKIVLSSKKKLTDTGFSHKKKLMVLRSLPNSTLLPNTPHKVKYCSTSMLTPRTLVTRPDCGKPVRHNSSAERKRQASQSDDSGFTCSDNFLIENSIGHLEYNCNNTSDNNDEFVSVRKDEFMDIKNRVSLLESKFQNEFEIISLNDRIYGSETNLSSASPFCLLENEPMSVDDVFNATVQESRKLTELSLNSDFEIRKPQRPIRSPSARKIGSFRNKRRINRHSSLNLCDRPSRSRYQEDAFSSKRLRRGRPNTVFSGLPLPSGTPNTFEPNLLLNEPPQRDLPNAEPVPMRHFEHTSDKWPTARILKDQPSSSESRRSSLHVIRQRNAGMVLQKAKLFGDVKSRLGDTITVRRNVCVHTPSPNKFVTSNALSKERTPVILSNISNLRSPRVYRSNIDDLANT